MNRFKCRLGFHKWEKEYGDFGTVLSECCINPTCWTNNEDGDLSKGFFRRIRKPKYIN